MACEWASSGTGHFIDNAGDVLGGSLPVTITTWIKPETGGFDPVFFVGNVSTWSQLMVLDNDGFKCPDSGILSSAYSYVWYFVAFVYHATAANNKLYYAQHGASSFTSETGTSGSTYPSNTDFYIGGNAFANEASDFTIAAIKIWSREFSEAECWAEKRSYLPVNYYSDVEAVYPMFDNQSCPDFSGNGNDLTLSGTAPSIAAGPPIPFFPSVQLYEAGGYEEAAPSIFPPWPKRQNILLRR